MGICIFFVIVGLAFMIHLFLFCKEQESTVNLMNILFGLIFLGAGFYMYGHIVGKSEGEKTGAYKQMRGVYEITYTIGNDSCVIDTVIHVK